MTDGRIRTRGSGHAHWRSCFAVFVDHVPAGAPGGEDGPGFLRGGLLRAWAAKSRGDDDPAELDGHVVVGGFGLRGVPAGSSTVTGHVVGCVPVQGVPEGDQAETDQPEGHGSFHGTTCPIPGLAYPYDLTGVGEGLLDSPTGGITGYQIFRGRCQIGGDQRKSITAVVTIASAGLVVADQNDAHGSAAKRSVPQTDPFGDLHRVGAAVATDL